MTDTLKLECEIADSGLKKEYIAKEMGMTIQTLNNKIRNRTSFTAGEIDKLCNILGIADVNAMYHIFFASKVN